VLNRLECVHDEKIGIFRRATLQIRAVSGIFGSILTSLPAMQSGASASSFWGTRGCGVGCGAGCRAGWGLFVGLRVA
jgi:hypothetical protein